jgi:hypothetical protein
MSERGDMNYYKFINFMFRDKNIVEANKITISQIDPTNKFAPIQEIDIDVKECEKYLEQNCPDVFKTRNWKRNLTIKYRIKMILLLLTILFASLAIYYDTNENYIQKVSISIVALVLFSIATFISIHMDYYNDYLDSAYIKDVNGFITELPVSNDSSNYTLYCIMMKCFGGKDHLDNNKDEFKLQEVHLESISCC